MSLNYFIEKIKGSESEICRVLIILSIGFLAFGLGRLSKLEESKPPITIIDSSPVDIQPTVEADSTASLGNFVASKSGSSYYFPWCQGVKKIKEANKIWFKTKAEALAAGYSPAGNCKGL